MSENERANLLTALGITSKNASKPEMLVAAIPSELAAAITNRMKEMIEALMAHSIPDGTPHRLYKGALDSLESFQSALDNHDLADVISQAMIIGSCIGISAGSALERDLFDAISKKARTKTDTLNRIRELRDAGESWGKIAMKLNDEGFKKSKGSKKPFTAEDARGYINRKK